MQISTGRGQADNIRHVLEADMDRKKMFVRTVTNLKPTCRKRGTEEVSRRSTSTVFFENSCVKFFLQTLGLGEVAVKNGYACLILEKS